ncbi:MAG TPA: hypothetical protein VMW87_00945 [Spirochaetia bacterium]|nr:hypothetical protein [Spirochaetia bacterium]
MNRRISFHLLLAAAVLSVTACAHPVIDFSFHRDLPSTSGSSPGAAADSLPLVMDHRIAIGSEGSFLPAVDQSGKKPARSTARFSLKNEATVASGEVFSITYSSNGEPLRLQLFVRGSGSTAPGEIATDLPAPEAGDSHTSYLVPLDAGTRLTGFRVTGGTPGAVVKILGARLTNDYPGVRLENGGLVIRAGVGYKSVRTGDSESSTVSFASLSNGAAGRQVQVAVTYAYQPGSGRVGATLWNASATKRFVIEPHSGEHTDYFYTAMCGFVPENLEITSSRSGFRLESVSVTAPQGSTPIPADLGAVLLYDPASWRQPDYELFSWNLVPSVLVVDFRNLAVQARYMKRLAFFVEKAGYAGKLWPNSILDSMHGWNAHDYRPEDLARFFTAAVADHFSLNPEEVRLAEILSANGVIRKVGAGFVPGNGAIITASHDDPYWLRYLLLTHEGYHGIYFTHPAYREAIAGIWASIPLQEKEFWQLFLGSKTYNSRDSYLVVNEFQAYLMQQPVSAITAYYDRNARELSRSPAWNRLGIGPYLQGHPAMFADAAHAVQAAVFAAAGVDAGALVSILPDSK